MQVRVVENGFNKMFFSPQGNILSGFNNETKQKNDFRWKKLDIYIFPKHTVFHKTQIPPQKRFPPKKNGGSKPSVFFPNKNAKGSHPGLCHCSFIQSCAFQKTTNQQKHRCEEHLPSLKLTVRHAPENRSFDPKGNEKVFQPSIFRCYVSFREGSWWFFTNPFEKICAVVKLDHFPRDPGESKKCLKPPARIHVEMNEVLKLSFLPKSLWKWSFSFCCLCG